MSTKIEDGGPAFPFESYDAEAGMDTVKTGLSLRDYFAAAALGNPVICTGQAPEFYIRKWFGRDRSYSVIEVAAMQAYAHADAMLAARAREGEAK